MTTPDRPDTRPDTVVAEPGPNASADEIVADIEVTRAELGDTVDALAQKLDVKAQAQHGLDEAKSRATQAFGQARDALTDGTGHLTEQARSYAVTGAVVVGGVLLVRVIARRRRRR